MPQFFTEMCHFVTLFKTGYRIISGRDQMQKIDGSFEIFEPNSTREYQNCIYFFIIIKDVIIL